MIGEMVRVACIYLGYTVIIFGLVLVAISLITHGPKHHMQSLRRGASLPPQDAPTKPAQEGNRNAETDC